MPAGSEQSRPAVDGAPIAIIIIIIILAVLEEEEPEEVILVLIAARNLYDSLVV